VVYSVASDPRCERSIEALMDSSAIKNRLSELRRELEEILAMVSTDSTVPQTRRQDCEYAPDETSDVQRLISQPPNAHQFETEELFNGALVVITEFGQASAAILQMWLSIDYNRATQILTKLEADGLISSNGKLRHKAFALRRSKLSTLPR
jgi:DNA segregation ATPase FtsK/SpoIIIE-like protein